LAVDAAPILQRASAGPAHSTPSEHKASALPARQLDGGGGESDVDDRHDGPAMPLPRQPRPAGRSRPSRPDNGGALMEDDGESNVDDDDDNSGINVVDPPAPRQAQKPARVASRGNRSDHRGDEDDDDAGHDDDRALRGKHKRRKLKHHKQKFVRAWNLFLLDKRERHHPNQPMSWMAIRYGPEWKALAASAKEKYQAQADRVNAGRCA
jgi:hypothetical protein